MSRPKTETPLTGRGVGPPKHRIDEILIFDRFYKVPSGNNVELNLKTGGLF